MSSSNEADKASISNNNAYFHSGDTLDLTWNPNSFLSYDYTGITPNDLLIDIKLYELQYNEETFEMIATELALIACCMENTGRGKVAVPSSTSQPSLIRSTQSSDVIKTVTIFIEAKLKPTATGLIRGFTNKIGQWTDRVLATIDNQVNDILWQKCQEWADEQPPSIGQTLLDRVSNTPCPPNENQARAVNSGLDRDTNTRLVAFFHPEADRCYRQRTITR